MMAGVAGAEDSANFELTGGLLNVQRANHEWVHGPARIDSLDESAKSASIIMPVIILEISYSAEPGGVEYYADSPVSEDGKLMFGMRSPTGIGVMDTFFYAELDKEVWQNPFLVGTDRKETRATSYGAELGLSEIGGTHLVIEYGAEFLIVGTDIAGSLHPELERDGMLHRVELGWAQEFSGGFSVRPSVIAERGNFDGSAMSFDGSAVALELGYEGQALIIESRFELGRHSYDAEHPLFASAREDDSVSAYLLATMPGVFDRAKLSLKAGLIWESTESNINFYDARGDLLFGGVGYRF